MSEGGVAEADALQPPRSEAAGLLARRLLASNRLEARDVALIETLAFDVQDHPARATILAEGGRPTRCVLVMRGVASRQQLTRDGAQQIHSVHIVGEVPDLLSLHLKRMDHSLHTLSPCRLAFVRCAELWDACKTSPSLTAALWRETLVDAAIQRTSILRISRLAAAERVAHFLCEMLLRFESVGAAPDRRFVLDMTQQDIGDVLALSFVSVNRALRELRERGLASMERRVVTILERAGLAECAQFDPTYLHMGE
jgi:CRP-like cAMP-binding protein